MTLMADPSKDHIISLEKELDWLSQLLDQRMQSYFESKPFDPAALPPPQLQGKGAYGKLVQELSLTIEERIALCMSLVPNIRPQLFDRFFIQNKSIARSFTEFGGADNAQHRGFVPTGETVCFVIAEKDLQRRITLLQMFSEDHVFYRRNILRLSHGASQEMFWSGRLTLSEEYLALLTTGKPFEPRYSPMFPAQRLQTYHRMEDLVLSPMVLDEVSHILHWLRFQSEIREDSLLQQRFRKGYRALFHGPPGTGKTLTVAVIGHETNRPVFRIDLSQLVSKYIGETEKNLSTVFALAENKNWILFFDEAESLFSKRTEVSDSKDRYANQETSYLLQRIENFDGLVILATNLKPNIDRAFLRRFQSIISFNVPEALERERIWRNLLSGFGLDKEVDLATIARDHEVSGGSIHNAVQFAWLNARSRESAYIQMGDLVHGVIRELGKEGKTSRI
ncbi:MAG: ATP-binding protein [Bacteroidetes bacterium]|nr:ATP-binding protein [Bacteroidota bacterium]